MVCDCDRLSANLFLAGWSANFYSWQALDLLGWPQSSVLSWAAPLELGGRPLQQYQANQAAYPTGG